MAAPPVQLLDVLLFASAADAFGAPQVRLEVPVGATAADVREALFVAARAVSGQTLPASSRLAVNQRFVAPGQPVAPGDELALIPPVAGG
jgi:molybdopterin converting factor small subunit